MAEYLIFSKSLFFKIYYLIIYAETPSTDMELILYLLINGNYSGERLTYRSKKFIIVLH